MDQSIFGVIAPSNNQDLAKNNVYVDQSNDPNLALKRYHFSMALFASFVTDFFCSIDYGFHVILIPKADNNKLAQLDEWRIPNRLPMFQLNKVLCLKDGKKSHYSVAILQGKKIGKIANNEQDYAQKVKDELISLGITKFKFYPCSFDASTTCPLKKPNKFKKIKGKIETPKAILSPLELSLKQCILEIDESDQVTDPNKFVDDSIQSILLTHMRSNLWNLGFWHCDYFRYAKSKFITSDDLIEIIKSNSNFNSDSFYASNDCKDQTNATESSYKFECRSALLLKNFFEQGWYFEPQSPLTNYDYYDNNEAANNYEKLLQQNALVHILDFDPYTVANINPITFWQLDYIDRTAFTTIVPRLTQKNLNQYLHAKLLNIANYVTNNSYTDDDQNYVLEKFQNYQITAFFRINLDGADIDLNEINISKIDNLNDLSLTPRYEQILNIFKDLKPSLNHKTNELNHNFSIDQKIIDQLVDLDWGTKTIKTEHGHPNIILPIWFHEYAQTIPNIRCLHHYFFIVHKLATLLRARSFIFGFDTPFNDKWICATYSKTGKNSSNVEELIRNGILFKGVNAKRAYSLHFCTTTDSDNCFDHIEICEDRPVYY